MNKCRLLLKPTLIKGKACKACLSAALSPSPLTGSPFRIAAAKRSLSYFSSMNGGATSGEKSNSEKKLVTDLVKRLKEINTATLCDADKAVLSRRHAAAAALANGGDGNEEGESGKRDGFFPSLPTYVGLGLMNTSVRLRNRGKTHAGSGESGGKNDDANKGYHMVGVARTVQCTRPNDFLGVLRGLDEAKAGEVLVVNSLDSSRSIAGGLFLTEASRKGLAAIIVDGPVRDTETLEGCSALIYSTSVTPYAGTVQSIGEMQVPVTCGGIRVSPGDIVVGDGDGVVVGSVSTFLNLIETAENIHAVENTLMSGMALGISLHSMSNYKEHLEARMKGKESALDFRKKRLVSFDGLKPLHYE